MSILWLPGKPLTLVLALVLTPSHSVARLAIICESVQLVTTPRAVPSQTNPVFCVSPKLQPEIVTSVPATALVGVTEEIDGAVADSSGSS
jgi:hypothetical protein